jgi:hypothetical protein
MSFLKNILILFFTISILTNLAISSDWATKQFKLNEIARMETQRRLIVQQKMAEIKYKQQTQPDNNKKCCCCSKKHFPDKQ